MKQQLLDTAHLKTVSHAVLSIVKVCLMILAMTIIGLSGCDPVRTIRHSVRLAVTDERGAPVADVEVSIKESWESWKVSECATHKTWSEDYCRQRWERFPWFQGATDIDGKAAIRIEISEIDGTRGTMPPANRDRVSNREFLVKLQNSHVEEEVSIAMKPGSSAVEGRYTIIVEEIEEPSYVP